MNNYKTFKLLLVCNFLNNFCMWMCWSQIWRAVCYKIFSRELTRTTTMFQFREIESYYFSGDWNVSFSGDWNMSFWENYNTSIFGRLKCVVLRRLKYAIFGRLKLKYLIFVILKYFNFREIDLCHSWRLKYVLFEIL